MPQQTTNDEEYTLRDIDRSILEHDDPDQFIDLLNMDSFSAGSFNGKIPVQRHRVLFELWLKGYEDRLLSPLLVTEADRDLEGIAMNIVHQLGDLYVPNGNEGIDLRQSTNDKAITFVKQLIQKRDEQRKQVVLEDLISTARDYHERYPDATFFDFAGLVAGMRYPSTSTESTKGEEE